MDDVFKRLTTLEKLLRHFNSESSKSDTIHVKEEDPRYSYCT